MGVVADNLLRIWGMLPRRSGAWCVVCEKQIGRFLPYRGGLAGIPPMLRELDLIGSDVKNFSCPRCGSFDRERHLVLYMKHSGLFESIDGSSVLHFAPERHLSRLITERGPRHYVRGDLFPTSPDYLRLDIQALPFESETFDLVIANHVLEHVEDDLRALAEIGRVLVPNGAAILQTPFSSKLQQTWSDSGIDSDSARLQAYGQEDHVRLYGKDIFDRFGQFDLRSCVGGHSEILPEVSSSRFGVNAREPFFLFRKGATDA